ncbi:MAG: hypothetical protein QM820_35075 [Minicystis sp.]
MKAPKNRAPVSSAMGAARSMVGVPTDPRSARTPSGPRSMAVADTGGCPAVSSIVVVGQRGGAPLVRASSRARAFFSAESGM